MEKISISRNGNQSELERELLTITKIKDRFMKIGKGTYNLREINNYWLKFVKVVERIEKSVKDSKYEDDFGKIIFGMIDKYMSLRLG